MRSLIVSYGSTGSESCDSTEEEAAMVGTGPVISAA